jgi:predicted AAA+ superfamily ATPase
MIDRILKNAIIESIESEHKVIVIYGPRQVGKTTLVNQLLKNYGGKVIRANGDEMIYHDLFSSRDLKKMQDFIDDSDLLFIDEAQNIKDIGINLKILHDKLPNLKIIITGSSSLELASGVKEPLTGRTSSFLLFPISLTELKQSKFEINRSLSDCLIYGLYPEIVSTPVINKKISKLRELASSYLYKDILTLSNIRNSDKIFKLLQLLAHQIGQPVSINELAISLSLSSETVNRYLDLLEKTYVIFRFSSLSRNSRKEISKMSKIYFYDTGIRNTLIDNFQPLENRNDKGQLFENFIVMERIKMNAYRSDYSRYYFWRSYGGGEIDFIESRDDKYHAFEIKSGSKMTKAPPLWIENYPNSEYHTVNSDNYLDFVLS